MGHIDLVNLKCMTTKCQMGRYYRHYCIICILCLLLLLLLINSLYLCLVIIVSTVIHQNILNHWWSMNDCFRWIILSAVPKLKTISPRVLNIKNIDLPNHGLRMWVITVSLVHPAETSINYQWQTAVEKPYVICVLQHQTNKFFFLR